MFLLLVCWGIVLNAQEQDLPANQIIREQINGPHALQQPYVILVSIDGFRYDYAKKYKAKNLQHFSVNAQRMEATFPTKTFANHYGIVSGLYPGNSGIVSNSFYNAEQETYYSIGNRTAVRNGANYKGTPLWVLASQQDMVTASMFWVGSEAAIQDTRPTYYFNYDGSVTHAQRVNQCMNWLKLPADKRPHLITLYFSITDDVGHKHGPESEEMKEAVLEIDSVIGSLQQQLTQIDLPVNTIVVSDHGMINILPDGVIDLSEVIPADSVVTKSYPLMVYSKNEQWIDSIYTVLQTDTTRYHVYKKSDMPAHFHYQVNDPCVGDLLVMPKPQYIFGKAGTPVAKGKSTHGYDPTVCSEMGAVFYATGPHFKKRKNIAAFENVHVYPLIATLLGLQYDANAVDGDNRLKFLLDR